MVIQHKTIKVSRISGEKAATRLKSHLKYLQYRQRNREREQTKGHHFFNGRSDHINRCRIHQSIMHGRIGNVYYYCLLLSPTHDEPVNNGRQWTRAMMCDLEQRFGLTLNWYAIEHRDADHLHIHMIVQGMGKDRETGVSRAVIFRPRDFAYLREQGRAYSGYKQLRFMAEIVRMLDEGDTISS